MNFSKNSLYIVSTPIGNLEDITLRAIKVLENSDMILCEDTRSSIKLLNHLKIKKKLVSYHKFNEKKQMYRIIEQIKMGKILSLISDAGTPLLSDPGKLLLNECINKKIDIIPVPGVSSITTAMSVSGYDDKFLFYGFLPKFDKEVDAVLEILSKQTFSLVFFTPSQKINFYLRKFKIFFRGRKIFIARELTKIHETFYREEIDNLKTFKAPMKGELTIVISNTNPVKKNMNKEKIINKVKKYLKK